MAKYNTLGALFTAIANSLRSKTGGSGKIVADDLIRDLSLLGLVRDVDDRSSVSRGHLSA